MSFLQGLFGPPDVTNLQKKGDVRGLIKALSYEKDDRVRLRAAEALGKIGDVRAVEPLGKAIEDTHKEVREAAVRALGQMNDPRIAGLLINALKFDSKPAVEILIRIGAPAVDPLIAAFKNGGVVVEFAAREALVQIGAPAVEPLLVVLEDNNNTMDIRMSAAYALGQIGDARAAGPLCAMIKGSDIAAHLETIVVALGNMGDAVAVDPLIGALTRSDERVQYRIIEALGKIHDPRTAELLISIMLQDENLRLHHIATKALDQIGWKPEQDRTGAAYWVARQDWNQCISIGELAIEPLIAILRRNKEPYFEKVRCRAVETLGEIGDPRAVEPLILMLQDDDMDVRRSAIKALGQMGDIRALEPLMTALNLRDEKLRLAAAEAISKIGTPAIAPLISAFKSDNNLSVSDGAAEALVKIGAPAVEALITALQDRDWHVSYRAASVLGRIKDLRAVEPLIDALKNKDICSTAAKALGQIGDPRAVESLKAAIEDKNADVRKFAIIALAQIGNISVMKPLEAALEDGDRSVRDAAANALDQLGWKPGQNKAGAAYWVIKQEWKRVNSMGALALQPLRLALEEVFSNKYSSDKIIPRAICEALAQIGGSQVEEWLIMALEGPNNSILCDEAATALVKIGGTAALALRNTALQHKDRRIRLLAIETLGRIGLPAIDPLSDVLLVKNWDIRRAAANALEKLEWHPGQDEKGAHYWITVQQWDKCIAVGSPAIEPLIDCLMTTGGDIRHAAAKALVALYQTGQLDENEQQRILSQRQIITESGPFDNPLPPPFC